MLMQTTLSKYTGQKKTSSRKMVSCMKIQGLWGIKKEKLGVREMKMTEIITMYFTFSKIKIVNGEVQKNS